MCRRTVRPPIVDIMIFVTAPLTVILWYYQVCFSSWLLSCRDRALFRKVMQCYHCHFIYYFSGEIHVALSIWETPKVYKSFHAFEDAQELLIILSSIRERGYICYMEAHASSLYRQQRQWPKAAPSPCPRLTRLFCPRGHLQYDILPFVWESWARRVWLLHVINVDTHILLPAFTVRKFLVEARRVTSSAECLSARDITFSRLTPIRQWDISHSSTILLSYRQQRVHFSGHFACLLERKYIILPICGVSNALAGTSSEKCRDIEEMQDEMSIWQ